MEICFVCTGNASRSQMAELLGTFENLFSATLRKQEEIKQGMLHEDV